VSRKTFLIFGSPAIQEEEISEVVDSLRSGWLSTGPKVARFEEMFKQYIGAKHALAVNSCTAGLHLSMLASGVGPGDEVITTPLTFAATANAILHVGARPVFVDVEPTSMNIDANQIERKVGSKTRAILPVHLAGRPCDMDPILDIAQRHHLLVIEDAAHAIESQYHGRKVGTLGHLAAFSFYVTKNVVTGEGGMVTTENDEWAAQVQLYALHGMSKGAWHRFSDDGYKHYLIVCPGFKYNMMDLQAAIGIHQLGRVERNLQRREQIWRKYDEAFEDLPVSCPSPPQNNTRHARHLYTLLLDIDHLSISRDQFQQALYERNIGTGIHYISLHLHPYYKETFGYRVGDFPNARYISERTISLPLSAKLTKQDTDDVIEAVTEVIQTHKK